MSTTTFKPTEMPAKPTALPIKPHNVPAELKGRKRFVVWRYTWRTKEATWDKPPLQFNGAPAKANDPTTWCDFNLAVAICQKRGYDGIGFVPTEEDGLVLFDLDHVVNPDGALGTWSPKLRAMFAGDVPDGAQ